MLSAVLCVECVVCVICVLADADRGKMKAVRRTLQSKREFYIYLNRMYTDLLFREGFETYDIRTIRIWKI